MQFPEFCKFVVKAHEKKEKLQNISHDYMNLQM